MFGKLLENKLSEKLNNFNASGKSAVEWMDKIRQTSDITNQIQGKMQQLGVPMPSNNNNNNNSNNANNLNNANSSNSISDNNNNNNNNSSSNSNNNPSNLNANSHQNNR
jgi:hypothetical protein